MTVVSIIHFPAERPFALELRRFLETGCHAICYCDEGEDLIGQAERFGLGGDVLIVVLSKASCAAGWPERKKWESVFIGQAREAGVHVVFFQLEDCAFPGVFNKQFAFFDARDTRIRAMRRLKRWFWQLALGSGESAHTGVSGDLETVYAAVADRAGALEVSGEAASRFAVEASQEFAAVLWVPCSGRSLAQILGHIGGELRMQLAGPVEENREKVFQLLAERRCLVILDGLDPNLTNDLVAMGRSSTLVTTDALVHLQTVDGYMQARELVVAGRLAEALEMLQRVSAQPGMQAMCQREIAWILNAWGRVEEANAASPDGPRFAVQLSLFG